MLQFINKYFMKKILYLVIFLSLFQSSALAKIFKSKNGYSFIVPSGHKVIELDIKKAASNVEKSDAAKSMDKELLQDSLDVNVQYVTYIVLKKERNPDQFNSNITASKDILFEANDFSKAWCPDFEAYFDAMVPVKKINLYNCLKETIKVNNLDTDALKFVYDTMFPETYMYHYMITLNNHMINFAGTCLEKNCPDLDKNLKKIAAGFNWR